MTVERVAIACLFVIVGIQLFLRDGGSPNPRSVGRPATAEAPDGVSVDVGGRPVLGDFMAPVVLIEFSDYECPFCSRHATTVFPELREDWIEGGDLAVVFVNNPLGIHPNARTLAAGAICGGELGDYWAWHERIFVDAIRSTDGLLTLADYFGIERRAFEECMSDELTAETIERDIDEAERLGFTATPSFALGRRRTNNRNVVEVEKYIFGAQPYSIFADAMSLLIQAEGGQLVGNAIPN